MKWKVFFLVFLFVLGSGSVTAAEIDNVDMIPGETYTVTFDIPAPESQQNILVTGPMTRVSSSESNTSVSVTVQADSVSSQTTGSIFVETDQNEYQTDVTVFSDPSSGTNGSNVQARSNNYQQLQDQWVRQRINRRTTDDGTLTVYEQLDPTRGPIDPETGLPEGEWVQVDIDENGNAQWLFDTPRGAMAYMAQKANTRYQTRTNWLAGSVGIVAISWAIQLYVLPKYRKREEENYKFQDNR